ncbi:MAG: FHA domain-containing protein [Anaerolineaceae bacterium]
MINCPNCQKKNSEGTIFCGNCGTRLDPSPAGEGEKQVKQANQEKLAPPSTKPLKLEKDFSENRTEISLLVLDNGKIITVKGQKEYSIGRISKGQAIIPDVDLSPFEAHKKGVSRLHAYLKIDKRGVVIVDMGSANGTKVNGQRIAPNVDYPLKHADTIVLGSIPLQIILDF